MSEREGYKKILTFFKIYFWFASKGSEILLLVSNKVLIWLEMKDHLQFVFIPPSQSSEWVCTKTVFTNGSVVRGCEKTYTGNRWILWRHLASEIKEKNPISIFVGGETFSMCFWSDMKGKVLLKINIYENLYFKKRCWAK